MKWLIRKTLFLYPISLICSLLFSLFPHAYAQEPIDNVNELFGNYVGDFTFDNDTLIDLLIRQQETKKTKRQLILHYCDVVLQSLEGTNLKNRSFTYDNYLYDPRQSWFVYALCVNIDEKSKWREILWEKYKYRNYKKQFEKITYPGVPKQLNMSDFAKENLDLNEIREIPAQPKLDGQQAYTPCNPVESMQACQFSRFLPKIWTTIMNDYSNLRLASLYWYKFLEAPAVNANSPSSQIDPEELKQAVRAFSDAYFGDKQLDNEGNPIGDPQSPCNDEATWYLNPTDVEGNKKHCSHPKTYLFVEWTIKSALKLIEKTKLLDGGKVLQMECKEPNRQLMACWFAVHGNAVLRDDMKVFQNMLLNELLRYKLFITYYTQTTLDDPSYNPLTIGSSTFSYRRSVNEYVTISYEQQLAEQAIEQTMRMLHQVGVYYPIHVWLAAYYEDLVNYRKTVTKSYTPLHQLSYLFRNVQACQE